MWIDSARGLIILGGTFSLKPVRRSHWWGCWYWCWLEQTVCISESGPQAAAMCVCMSRLRWGKNTENTQNRQDWMSEDIGNSEVKSWSEDLCMMSQRESLVSVSTSEWLFPGLVALWKDRPTLETSQLHFRWVNKCFGLSPKEFMRSLYLLTLHPEKRDIDQINIRPDHTGYALKLSELCYYFVYK